MQRYLTVRRRVGMQYRGYKFITYADWEANYTGDYPNARSNQDKTEVVLSCLDGVGTLTKEEAAYLIELNWGV